MQKSNLKEIIFLNGKLIPSKDAKISCLEPGFLSGWGLFETMRSLNGKIVYLDNHLKRLKASCALIGLEFAYSIKELKGLIRNLVKINDLKDAYVRLTLWKSKANLTDILIIAKKYKPYTLEKYKKGFRVCISSYRQNEFFLTQIKTTSRLLYELAQAQAKDRGFAEAIILNRCGYITEGTRSNIFFVKDKTLFTPALECGCLGGITRQVIFDLVKKYNLKVEEGKFVPSDLYRLDEAFLTNSLIGVMPLVAVENNLIGKGRPGKLTQFLMGRYNLLLKYDT